MPTDTLALAESMCLAPAFDWFLADATDADLARELETLEADRTALCRSVTGGESDDELERLTRRGERMRTKIDAIRAEQARRATTTGDTAR